MTIKNIKEAFLKACSNGDKEDVESFIPYIESIDIRTKEGWTGLILACHGKHYAVAKTLIANGADVNASNSKGTTVFMYAKTPIIESGEIDFLDYLIAKGANPNAIDSFGKTALDYVSDITPEGILVEYLTRYKKDYHLEKISFQKEKICNLLI
jgi:ankyrin repeat protein